MANSCFLVSLHTKYKHWSGKGGFSVMNALLLLNHVVYNAVVSFTG